jgi:hypothetical protein
LSNYKEREMSGDWVAKLASQLVGRTITEVRRLTREEQDGAFGFEDELAIVVILSDGTYFLPLRDPEGNGAGFLYVESRGGRDVQAG